VIDDVEPDLSMREAKIGDRYLLCSDGLSGVVSFETLEDTMAAGRDPAATCEQLVQLALRSGAPDNVTCIVADIVDAIETPTDTVPVVVGAASQHPEIRSSSGSSAAERAAELTGPPTNPIPLSPPEPKSPGWRRSGPFRIGLATLVVVLLLAGGGYGAYRWSQAQFFVGDSSGSVAIFRGLPQAVGPVQLSSVASIAPDVPVSDLPPYTRNQVRQGITASDESAAQGVVQRLREEAAACQAAATPTATPTVTPTTAPTTTTKPKSTTARGAASTKSATSGAATVTSTPTTTATPTTSGTVTAEDCRGLG
jgi:protein phosphatase